MNEAAAAMVEPNKGDGDLKQPDAQLHLPTPYVEQIPSIEQADTRKQVIDAFKGVAAGFLLAIKSADNVNPDYAAVINPLTQNLQALDAGKTTVDVNVQVDGAPQTITEGLPVDTLITYLDSLINNSADGDNKQALIMHQQLLQRNSVSYAQAMEKRYPDPTEREAMLKAREQAEIAIISSKPEYAGKTPDEIQAIAQKTLESRRELNIPEDQPQAVETADEAEDTPENEDLIPAEIANLGLAIPEGAVARFAIELLARDKGDIQSITEAFIASDVLSGTIDVTTLEGKQKVAFAHELKMNAVRMAHKRLVLQYKDGSITDSQKANEELGRLQQEYAFLEAQKKEGKVMFNDQPVEITGIIDQLPTIAKSLGVVGGAAEAAPLDAMVQQMENVIKDKAVREQFFNRINQMVGDNKISAQQSEQLKQLIDYAVNQQKKDNMKKGALGLAAILTLIIAGFVYNSVKQGVVENARGGR